jgi:serine/threonine protein kinase
MLWDRICEVYSAVQAVSPEEREALLVRECGGDATLEREVKVLLNLSSMSPEFLSGLAPALAPIVPLTPSLTPGQVLSGRFEILRFVGAGGMGEVYEAMDRDLGEHVAVKVLRPSRLAMDELIARLRRELKLARRISHVNVCRVFDFARHEMPDGSELNYYVMEYLDGVTLSQRLGRDGAVPLETAIEIARQMSEGLAAAHHVGIVHRDFKPANVMLVETGSALRAIVTDFGLATVVDRAQLSTSLGSTGLVLGTPGYVAPEQLYAGAVTPATDIYAYGIVLHELITGMHPRATEAGTAPIPQEWKQVIDKCMQLDPVARFISVGEAYQSLLRPGRKPRFTSRRAFIAGAGASIAGVSLIAAVYRYSQGNGHLPAGGVALVTPVENTTQESRFDGLTAALQASLKQSAHVNVWNSQRLGTVLQSMRLQPSATPTVVQWREVAFREQADALVFSTLSKVGAGYVLSVTSERLAANPTQPAYSQQRSFPASGPDGLFEALHQAGTWIREFCGEDSTDIAKHNRLPQDITTNNWQALELLNRARKQSSTGQNADAILALRRATELDKEFALGFMHLGDILNAERNSEEGFTSWRRAITLARSQRLSDHEQLNIESRYAFETHDYKKAEATLAEWVHQFPNDALGHQLLISCLLDLGRYSDAVDRAKESRQRFGTSTFVLGILLRGLGATRRLSETEEPLAAIEKLSPNWWGPQMRGSMDAMRGDYASADQWFKKVTPASRAISLLATSAADRGDLKLSTELLRDGIKKDRESGNEGFASTKAAQLAFLTGEQGDAEGARVWALEAVKKVRPPRSVTLSASVLARHGFVKDARQLLEMLSLGEEPVFAAYRLRVEGEILVAEKKYTEAMEVMERCDRASKALESRDYLARALALSGDKPRARKIYRDLVDTPWIVWNNPESEWPGIRFIAQKYLQSNQEA